MRRSDIDRWTQKRLKDEPPPNGFVIRRDGADVEAFRADDAGEVSAYCRPGDTILTILPDGSVGLTYKIEESSATDAAAAASGALLTNSVVKTMGEQLGKAYEGLVNGFERLIASYDHGMKQKDAEISVLRERLAKCEGQSLEIYRLEKESKLEESRMKHSHAMTEEYLGKAFTVLDQLVDGFLQHHTRKDKLRGIFEKLKPETLQTIMGDLSEGDIADLMALAEDLDKASAAKTKKLQ